MALNGLVLWLVEQRRPPAEGAAATRDRHVRTNLALTFVLIVVSLALGVTSNGRGRPGAEGGTVRVLAAIVVLDGLAYLAHVLMHALPFGWRFHRVHHSDAHVDVTTAFRQHPLETLWRYGFQASGALVVGASSSAVAIYLAVSAVVAQVEHAHVSLPWRIERVARWVFATPAMHRVHHSRLPAETNTNYSNIFSVWDRVFGTYRAPRPDDIIHFGLDEYGAPERQQVAHLLKAPFVSQPDAFKAQEVPCHPSSLDAAC
jgi:sterol desaturase/sphingolipid hydroxylase (fatty acid hydroxylase superfamily)